MQESSSKEAHTRWRRLALRLSAALAVAAVLLSGIKCTQSDLAKTDANLAAKDIEPEAAQALKQMCDALSGAQAFRLHIEAVLDKPIATGQYAQFRRTSDITAVRPNRLNIETQGEEGSWAAWYCGKTLTLLDRKDNLFATETVPDRLDKMLDYLVDSYGLIMPAADLLVGETYQSLLANVDSGDYLGVHFVEKTKCHHLLFRQANIDWQIWIPVEGQPLPRKLVITRKLEPGHPQYVATISGWDLNPVTTEETFTCQPPAKAKSTTLAKLVGIEKGETP